VAAELKAARRTPDLRLLVEEHAKKEAGDPLLALYRGELFAAEGDYAAAEKAFAAALAGRPDAAVLADFRASRVRVRYELGKGTEAYREIGPKGETFAQLAELFLDDGEFAALGSLIDAHARVEPASPVLARYRRRLLTRQGQTAEAGRLLRTALAGEKDAKQRQEQVAEFLRDSIPAGKAVAGKAVAAYQAAPDAREAFALLAGMLDEDSERDEFRRLLAAHRVRHADDPGLAYHTGELHLAEGNAAKAAEVLLAGWRKAPEALRPRFRWRTVQALYRAGRWADAYPAVGPRHQTFEQLAGLLLADRRGADLERLLSAHRHHASDGPGWLLALARAELLAGRAERAVALFREAWLKQTDDEKQDGYIAQFVSAMDEVGRGLEAYRACPDREEAFTVLAPRLLFRKRTKELLVLLEEHRQNAPNDSNATYQLGELYLLRGDLARAEQVFARALAGQPKDGRLRHALFRVRVKAGKAAATYREFGPGQQTFESLAGLCLAERNAGDLEALLAAHRQATPNADLLPWDLDLLWLKKDHAGAVRLLQEQRAALLEHVNRRWKSADYLVRGLVRLNRVDDAVREAQALVKRRRANRTLLVLALAARGDPAAATSAAAESPSWERESWYRDEDLGPLLRGAAFGAFREKYPPPKGDGATGK
jgi:Flp pilus assembly protein TadD